MTKVGTIAYVFVAVTNLLLTFATAYIINAMYTELFRGKIYDRLATYIDSETTWTLDLFLKFTNNAVDAAIAIGFNLIDGILTRVHAPSLDASYTTDKVNYDKIKQRVLKGEKFELKLPGD